MSISVNGRCKLKRVLLAWLPPLAYAALIFVVSHHPVPERIQSILPWDKLIHFVEYFILGFLVQRALGRESLPFLALAIALSAGYGALDEFHQSFIPGRFASAGDIVADAVGAMAGAVAAYHFYKKKKKGTQP